MLKNSVAVKATSTAVLRRWKWKVEKFFDERLARGSTESFDWWVAPADEVHDKDIARDTKLRHELQQMTEKLAAGHDEVKAKIAHAQSLPTLPPGLNVDAMNERVMALGKFIDTTGPHQRAGPTPRAILEIRSRRSGCAEKRPACAGDFGVRPQ